LRTSFTYHDPPQTRWLESIATTGATPFKTWSYEWSAEGELTRWNESAGLERFATYDLAGQLEFFGTPGTPGDDFEFDYDAGGNRTLERLPGQPDTIFTHDDVNSLETATVGPQTLRSWTYDDNGNCTTDTPSGSPATTYRWDAEDRLIEIARGSHTTRFAYDGLGRRVSIREIETGPPATDETLYYQWCGSEVCAEKVEANEAKRYLFAEGEAAAPGWEPAYYVRDHLGSVRYFGSSGTLTPTEYSYDPRGRETRLSGTEDAAFGYAGYFAHRPSGLDLTWYRAYDPTAARWLSRDPLGEFANGFGSAQNVNMYAYVGNSPSTYIDRLGLGSDAVDDTEARVCANCCREFFSKPENRCTDGKVPSFGTRGASFSGECKNQCACLCCPEEKWWKPSTWWGKMSCDI
jgi:RHS repeat-associated protein